MLLGITGDQVIAAGKHAVDDDETTQPTRKMTTPGTIRKSSPAKPLGPLDIYAAAANNTLGEVLANGGNINTKDTLLGATALHIAATMGNLEAVSRLLVAGANPAIRSNQGSPSFLCFTQTPMAGYTAHDCATNPLIRKQIALNTKDIFGNTPLHKATHNNDTKQMSSLINMAFINAQDNQGRTPLFIATWKNAVEAVKILLSAGADASIAANNHLKPINIATDSQVLWLLKHYMNKQEQNTEE